MDAMATKSTTKTKRTDWAQAAADALASVSKPSGRKRAPATSRSRIQKRRDQVQDVKGSAYVHELERGNGRVLCLAGMRMDDYKLKLNLPQGLRASLGEAGQRISLTICALADFALDQLHEEGRGYLIAEPVDAEREAQGWPCCHFTHSPGRRPLQLTITGPLPYPPRDGRDSRVSIWAPDALLTRVGKLGAEEAPAIVVLAAWGLYWLQRKKMNLVTRDA